MKKKVLSLFFIMLESVIYSQSLEVKMSTMAPTSPEAASIAKYVNYPVNYCTGLPKIEIPLYEIRSGDIVLPITLSFHASGLKANSYADWLGLGWSLNVEPMITREVKGMADEYSYLCEAPDLNNRQQWVQIANGSKDSQPDEFYYKLCNKSGGFFFYNQGNNREPVITPYEPIKLEYNTSLSLFNITDDNGLIYKFGPSLGYGALEWAGNNCTSWKAAEIESLVTSRKVIFDYYNSYRYSVKVQPYDLLLIEHYTGGSFNEFPCTQESTSVTEYSGHKKIKYCVDRFYDGYDDDVDLFPPIGPDEEKIQKNETASDLLMWGSQEISTRKLKTIIFDQGKVLFNEPLLGSRELKTMKVCDYAGKLIKQIRFFQTPYYNYNDNTRMRLDSIQIQDGNEKALEVYRFKYYSNEAVGVVDRLGNIEMEPMDFWGFYNGLNGYLIPAMWIRCENTRNESSFYVRGVSRRSVLMTTQQGMLKSIVYPTGRMSEFEYDINKYWRIDKGPFDADNYGLTNAGGLRIKEITETDSIRGQKIFRRFVYGKNECGYGIIKHKPVDSDFMCQKMGIYESGKTKINMFYPNAITNLFYSQGPPVLYDEVTEYFSKQEDAQQSNGKIVYKYNVYNDGGWRKDSLSTLTFNRKDEWRNGLLKSKVVYKYERGNYIPVTREGYVYTPYKESFYYPFAIYDKWLIFSNRSKEVLSTDIDRLSYAQDTIVAGCMKITSDTLTTYDGEKEIKKIRRYSYDNPEHMYQTSASIINSDGTEQTEIRRFVQDVVHTGEAETARQSLLAHNRIKELLEYTETKNNNSSVVSTRYKLYAGKPQMSEMLSNTGSNRLEESRIVYHLYDSHGNPVALKKDNSEKYVYLWGYNYQYPIAEIKGVEYDVVTALLPESTLADIAVKGTPDISDFITINTLREALPPYVQMTTYKYEPMVGLISSTDMRGITTTYEYDSFGRLQTIKDHQGNIIESYRYKLWWEK